MPDVTDRGGGPAGGRSAVDAPCSPADHGHPRRPVVERGGGVRRGPLPRIAGPVIEGSTGTVRPAPGSLAAAVAGGVAGAVADDAASIPAADRGLAAELREAAVNRGATGFGVCTAEPFPEVGEELERRRADGSHAGLTFTYRDPSVAVDVRRSYPWAERLVVLAWSYLPEAGSPGPPAAGTGRIARFATRDHYEGLRDALASVADALRSAGHRGAVMCDDHRLVDRAAAVRAGVGWWGKNTMILAPGDGPWLLLGSVVTDAEVATTAPMVRTCGSCQACIPACPTGALVAPGVLDARLCLARWAQAKGDIPVDMRGPMGDRIYGCDECLVACPPGSRLLARSDDPRGRVDLHELLGASDDELRTAYGHWYLPKGDPVIIRRNALVALGNTGGEAAVPVLVRHLGHRRPVLRRHAAWALGSIGSDAALTALRDALQHETDRGVRAEIHRAVRSSEQAATSAVEAP